MLKKTKWEYFETQCRYSILRKDEQSDEMSCFELGLH